MTKPMVLIHNTETGEVIEREMTTAEAKVYETDIKNSEIRKTEAQAKATARQAIADRLGLTADELQVLLG